MATGDLCTLANVREFLELPGADTGRDALISTTITAVSVAIRGYTQRELYPVGTATRVVRLPIASYVASLTPYDLRSVTSVALHVDETSVTVAAADYQVLPVSSPDGIYTQLQFSDNNPSLWNSDSARYFGYSRVTIVGSWGPATIPVDVTQAAVIAVASNLRRDIAALDLGDLQSDPRSMTPDRAISYTLPAATIRMLGPYRRVGLL